MNTHTGGKPPQPKNWSRNTLVLFAALLGLGLLMLIGRIIALPDVSLGQMIFPTLGGLFIAVALVVLVRKDQRERTQMTPQEKNRQDQGTPQ